MNRITSRLGDVDGLIRFFLVTAVFLVPTLIDLRALKPFDIVKFAALWCFGWVAIGLWAIQVIRGKARWVPSRSARSAGYFLAAVGVATVFSHARFVSFFGWYQRYGGFVSALIYVALFVLIINLFRGRPEQLREVLYALGEASIIVVAYAIVQWLRLDPINWLRASGKETKHLEFATLGNSNFAGGFLGITAPWLWHAFHRARATWVKAVVVAWAAAHLWALWLTSARGGLVAAGAGVGALLLMHRDRLPAWTKIAAIAAAAAVVLVGILVAFHPGSNAPPGPLRRVRVLRSETLTVRGYWWLAGLRIFASRPITGTGPDTFVAEYPRHLSAKAAKISDSESADKPHNVFIEYLANTGVLGFAAYVALIVAVLRRGVRRRAEATGEERLLLTTFIAVFAAYLGQAIFSIDIVPIAMSGWIALAGIAALSDPPVTAERRSAVRASARRSVEVGIAAVVTVGLVVYGAIRLQADHLMHDAAKQTQSGAAIGDIVATYQRAIQLQPFEPVYRGTAADFLEKHGNNVDDRAEKRRFLEASVRIFEKMNQLQGNFHLWKMVLAEAIADDAAAGGSRSFDEADDLFRRAERLAPYDWRVPVAWGSKLNVRANATRRVVFRCLARDQFRRATTIRPQEARPWIGLGETLAALRRYPQAAGALQRAVSNAKTDDDRVSAGQSLNGVLRQIASAQAKHKTIKPIRCS